VTPLTLGSASSSTKTPGHSPSSVAHSLRDLKITAYEREMICLVQAVRQWRPPVGVPFPRSDRSL
jgi:hypothetical protein